PIFIAQLIDNRVFYFKSSEVGMIDGGLGNRTVDRQRAGRGQMIAPVDRAHALVERIGRRRGKSRYGKQNPAREPGPQAGAVGAIQRSLERYTRACFAHGVGAERAQFVGQERFHALWASGEKCMTIGGKRVQWPCFGMPLSAKISDSTRRPSCGRR